MSDEEEDAPTLGQLRFVLRDNVPNGMPPQLRILQQYVRIGRGSTAYSNWRDVPLVDDAEEG